VGLDVGKAIAFMSGQTLPIWDFEDVGDNWTKANSEKIAPIIAVPTTAGNWIRNRTCFCNFK
jgi:alcohol dehydrogenase class IV